MNVTREQLASLEWSGITAGKSPVCPACRAPKLFANGQHHADCWLSAALSAAPPAPDLKRMTDKELLPHVQSLVAPPAPTPPPAGLHDGTLYCYGGCGTRYVDFACDVNLPTPLWNRIAVGSPFDKAEKKIDREGRGGVLCAVCIIASLAALPECTVIYADIAAPAPTGAPELPSIAKLTDGTRKTIRPSPQETP